MVMLVILLLVPGSPSTAVVLLLTPAAVRQLLYRLWISKEVARIKRSVHSEASELSTEQPLICRGTSSELASVVSGGSSTIGPNSLILSEGRPKWGLSLLLLLMVYSSRLVVHGETVFGDAGGVRVSGGVTWVLLLLYPVMLLLSLVTHSSGGESFKGNKVISVESWDEGILLVPGGRFKYPPLTQFSLFLAAADF